MPKTSYICNCAVIHEDIVNDAKLQILLPPVALQDHIHTSHSVLERVRFVL